jgi:hypothetical protein
MFFLQTPNQVDVPPQVQELMSTLVSFSEDDVKDRSHASNKITDITHMCRK